MAPKLTCYHRTRLKTLGDDGLKTGSYYQVTHLSHINISLCTIRSPHPALIKSSSSSPHPLPYWKLHYYHSLSAGLQILFFLLVEASYTCCQANLNKIALIHNGQELPIFQKIKTDILSVRPNYLFNLISTNFHLRLQFMHVKLP